MDVFWSKLLPLAVYPPGASILVLLASTAILVAGHRRAAIALLLCALSGLWTLSTPAFAKWITAGLERQYPTIPIDLLEDADVATVLGGILSPPRPPRLGVDLSDAIDRVFEAARIYQAGKVRYILVSGGNLPWSSSGVSEASLIAEVLIELGVPADALVIEPASRNTYENATNTARILEERGSTKPILVTSGTHMARALATFRRAGVDAIPAATDVEAVGPWFETVLDVLPEAVALARTTEALKEIIGLLVYKMRGWLGGTGNLS